MALPIRVAPGVGEPWAAYLERCAWRMRLDLRTLHTYLNDGGVGMRNVLQRLDPSASYVRRTADLLTLTEQQVDAMQFSRHSNLFLGLGTINDPVASQAAVERRMWLLPTSRACPWCLAHSGTWQLGWHAPWQFVCTLHDVFLDDACGTCQGPLRTFTRGWTRGIPFAGQVQHPTRCRQPVRRANRSYTEPCNHPIEESQPVNASADAVALQRELDQIRTAGTGYVVGQHVPADEAFAALRTAARLAGSLVAPNRSAPGPAWRPPLPAQRTFELLAYARAVITSPDADSAAETLERWFDRARVKPTRRSVEQRVEGEAGLQAVTDLIVSRNEQFAVRVFVQTQLWNWKFSASNIPQRAWPCAVPDVLANRRRPPSNQLLHAILAVMINRLRTVNWEQAATELG